MANDFANLALTVSSKEELLKLDYNGITVEEKLTEQTGVIGEKIEERVELLSGRIHKLVTPTTHHQRISGNIHLF